MAKPKKQSDGRFDLADQIKKAKVELRQTDQLIPYARNARKHEDWQVAQIAASIKEFGFTNPVLIDETGEIVAGHGRVMAALKLNLDEVPCIVLGHLTPTQRKAYVLADNQLALNSSWDMGLLGVELEELKIDGFDLDLLGFGDDELKAILDGANQIEGTEGLTDPDEVPEVEKPIVTKGEVWVLGNHRLMCGDSTVVTDVERLMGGEKAELCFTSPPYSQQRDYGVGKVSDWDALMNGVFASLPVKDNAQILVNLGIVHRDKEWDPYWNAWIDYMRTLGWRRFGWYVWDQGPGLPGDWNGRLAPSFEFIFHFNRESKRPNKTKKCIHAGSKNHGTGLRGKDGVVSGYTAIDDVVQSTKIPDSVVRVMRHKARGIECEHPAVYPVELVEEIISAFTCDGQSLYEPFTGSGSTIIACEKTGRRCFGMEIDPHYCTVILKRWAQFTGKEPARLEDDGSLTPMGRVAESVLP